MIDSFETRPLVVLPYASRIDRFGKVRMSSHTALVVDAAGHKFIDEDIINRIYLPGENTFGSNFPSTSALEKERLVELGVPEGSIVIGENLNDTEVQLVWVRDQRIQNPWVLDLGFHQERTEKLMKQLGISGETLNAEDIILRYHGNRILENYGGDPLLAEAALAEFIKTSQKMFGRSKINLAEGIMKTGTRFGKPGKGTVRLLRTAMGAQGATVTDYHFIGPAIRQLQEAQAKGLVIH
jgi:hypothetical protein